jgi:hypothetical protein
MNPFLPTTAAALAMTAACGFEPAGAPVPLTERLAERAHLTVSTASDLDATAVASGHALAIAPTITGGEVVVRTTADGYLLVEDLTLPLADVTLPAGMIAERPVRFTDLVLHLGTQLAVALPADAPPDALVGTGQADLILDWALVDADGEVVPLGLRKAPRTRFAVAITADATGALRADLAAHVAGTAMIITATSALRDVSLAVVGAEGVDAEAITAPGT